MMCRSLKTPPTNQPTKRAGGGQAEPQSCPLSFLPCLLENSSWSLLSSCHVPQPPGRAPGHIFGRSWALTGLFERKNSLNVTKGERAKGTQRMSVCLGAGVSLSCKEASIWSFCSQAGVGWQNAVLTSLAEKSEWSGQGAEASRSESQAVLKGWALPGSRLWTSGTSS